MKVFSTKLHNIKTIDTNHQLNETNLRQTRFSKQTPDYLPLFLPHKSHHTTHIIHAYSKYLYTKIAVNVNVVKLLKTIICMCRIQYNKFVPIRNTTSTTVYVFRNYFIFCIDFHRIFVVELPKKVIKQKKSIYNLLELNKLIPYPWISPLPFPLLYLHIL